MDAHVGMDRAHPASNSIHSRVVLRWDVYPEAETAADAIGTGCPHRPGWDIHALHMDVGGAVALLAE